jgi:hypothetical protein
MCIGPLCLFAENTEYLILFLACASCCTYRLVSCTITARMVWKYSKKSSQGCEFSVILGAAALFSPFLSTTNGAHLPYEKEVGGVTLNLHHFLLQQIMDPEVWYLPAILLSQCQHTALQRHLAQMLNRLTDICTLKVLPYWLRIGLLNSFECGNRKKHNEEPNWLLNARISYSVAILSSPHFSSLFVKLLYMHMNKGNYRWAVTIRHW